MQEIKDSGDENIYENNYSKFLKFTILIKIIITHVIMSFPEKIKLVKLFFLI